METMNTGTHRLLFALALSGALMWPVNTGPLAGGHQDDNRPSWDLKLCLEVCSIFEGLCPQTCADICGTDVECSAFCLPACSEFADECRTDCQPPDGDDGQGGGQANSGVIRGGRGSNGIPSDDDGGNRARGGR